MTRTVQQVLTALLLLIFLSEHVVLASAFQQEGEAAVHHQPRLVQHEILLLTSYLAEQNEERDWRDDASLSFRRDGETVHLMSMHILDPLHNGYYLHATLKDVPMYTYYCTYLL